jgi:hypothetical protein
MPNPRDVLYRKMAGRGGWAHLDLADALKVMEKSFHIATIKWLIVLIPVLIPDCLHRQPNVMVACLRAGEALYSCIIS